MCFRRERSPYASFDCALRDIDPAADYEVMERRGFQPSPPEHITGQQLQGYRATVDTRPGSLVIEYRRVSE